MTLSELIRILRGYERDLGSDAYVVLADDEEVIGDANSVGVTQDGDVVITIQD